MLTPAVSATSPRRLTVARPSIIIEGHALNDIILGGWAYGPELGTGACNGRHRRHYGVTVSAGRRPGATDRTPRGLVASAFRSGFNQPPALDRGVPMLARQRLHMAQVRRGPVTLDLRPWAGRLSLRHGSMAADATTPITFVGASLGGMIGVAFAVRYPERAASAWS